jgi:hypothetical protein
MMPRGKRFWKMTVICVAVVVGSASDGRGETPGAVTIAGAGTASCQTWSTTKLQGGSDSLEQWIFGFLSGAAYGRHGKPSQPNPRHGTDAVSVLSWIDKYCLSHSDAPVASAARAFIVAHPH